jgi:hypothetical protein
MRAGQEIGEPIEAPSMPGIVMMQVPLLEKEAQAGIVLAANLDVPDNTVGIQARNRQAILSDVWHSLRTVENVNEKVFDSIDDMVAEDGLTSNDVDYLADNLQLMMDYSSPAIDGMTEEVLAELKNFLREVDLSVLTGKRWAAVKLCISTLFPELLQARSLGITSTESSTTRSESVEST